jgi:transcription elongation GreA/GreB family factor
MRLPIRKSEILQSTKKISDNYLTATAVEKMKKELLDLEKNRRPAAAAEVRRLAELGDFSENAAYQIAKGKLRGINSRVTVLQDKIKNAIIIKPRTDGRVAIGSIVTMEFAGQEKIFEILGSQESDPTRGRISYLSPLGAALMGARVGEVVKVVGKSAGVEYKILKVA